MRVVLLDQLPVFVCFVYFVVKPFTKLRVDFLFVQIALGTFAALALFFAFHAILNPDEGFYLAASHFVAHGLRPYRDFGYTQGPLWPYFEVPWLRMFGESLAGQRLASLAWTFLMAGVGVAWLRTKFSWSAAAMWLVFLLGSPLWLAFSVLGKTYALAALAVVVGSIAVQARWNDYARWALFLSAAIVGIGSRLPTAGFFLPAGVGLLVLTRTWRCRLVALMTALALSGLAVWWASAGNVDRLFFWTLEYHRASTFYIPVGNHFIDCLRFAPVLWIFVGLALWQIAQRTKREEAESAKAREAEARSLNSRPSTLNSPSTSNSQLSTLNSDVILLASLAVAIVLNLAASTTYAEYVFPFLPALALVVSPFALENISSLRPVLVAGLAMVTLAAGWNYPPELRAKVLADAAEAEAFLRGSLPAGSVVGASMPEIPIAAGMKLPPLMAMGKFGLTEDFDELVASERRLLTPSSLHAIVESPETKALVFSSAYNWNFFWTLPSYRTLSPSAQNNLRNSLRQRFRLGFVNADYVIYLRR